jgi:hypothetical protein
MDTIATRNPQEHPYFAAFQHPDGQLSLLFTHNSWLSPAIGDKKGDREVAFLLVAQDHRLR